MAAEDTQNSPDSPESIDDFIERTIRQYEELSVESSEGEKGEKETPERTGEFLQEIARELSNRQSAGETLDFAALADRFKLSRKDLEHCLGAIAAGEESTGEELPAGLSSTPPLPSLPDDYEILGELGHGGMGVVYRARQKSLDREVAVKVLRPGESLFAERIERLQREAKSLARLKHRHIVSMHEIGEADGSIYFTMDLIEGSSLAELIARDEITPARATRLLGQVADGIAYAHSRGVIHRDIKPANILVDANDDAYIVDFGLARDTVFSSELTHTGDILGTPAYMSPEQARGDLSEIGEAADIYALGTVLYECLTSKAPFGNLPPIEALQAVIHDDPAPPRRLNTKIPRDLEVICLKAMAKEPERRYQGAQALFDDLERFSANRPIQARRPSVTYRLGRLARRRWRVLATMPAWVGWVVLVGFLTPDPGNLLKDLARAEALHEDGEHRAAALHLQTVIAEIEREPSFRANKNSFEVTPAFQVREAFVRCWMEEGDLLHSEGLSDESLYVFQDLQLLLDKLVEEIKTDSRSFEYLKRPEEIKVPEVDLHYKLAWLRSYCQARCGDSKRAIWSFSDFFGNPPFADRPARVDTVKRFNFLSSKLVEAMSPTLTPGHPGYETTMAFIEDAFLGNDLSWNSISAIWRNWFIDQGPAAVPLFATLITNSPHAIKRQRIDRADYTKFLENLRSIAYAIAGPDLEEKLAKLAENEGLDGGVRTLAAYLLAGVTDLPFEFQETEWDFRFEPSKSVPLKESGNLIKEDLLLVKATLQLHAELRQISRIEGYRKRVEKAVKLLGENLQTNRFILDWLTDHTAADVAGRDLSAKWVKWWNEHGGDDPQTWLAAGLKLEAVPTEDEAPSLMRSLISTRKHQAPWLHHLLTLVAPAALSRPLWPSWTLDEPSNLRLDWRDIIENSGLLEDPVSKKPHVWRIARFRLRGGDPEPELLWEEVRKIPIETPVEINHEEPPTPLNWRGGSIFRPSWARFEPVRYGLPGLDIYRGPDRRGPDTSRTRLVGKLAWSRNGLTFTSRGEIKDNRIRYPLPWGPAGGLIVAQLPSDRLTSSSWHIEPPYNTHFSLMIVEPPGSSDTPWTLADWRKRLSTEFSRHVERENKERDRMDSSVGSYSWSYIDYLFHTAAFFPVPEARGALARLDELNPKRPLWSRPSALPARILAGGPSFLDEPQFEECLDRTIREMRLGHRFWIRVLLARPEPWIQQLAFKHLRKKLLPGQKTRVVHPGPGRPSYKKRDLLPIGPRAWPAQEIISEESFDPCYAASLEVASRQGKIKLPPWLAQAIANAEHQPRWWWDPGGTYNLDYGFYGGATNKLWSYILEILTWLAVACAGTLFTLWLGRRWKARLLPLSILVILALVFAPAGAQFSLVPVLSIVFVLLALWPGRRLEACLPAASILVVLGLAFESTRLNLFYFDLLQEPLGYALCGLGACLLARAATGIFRWLTPVTFALAFGYDILILAAIVPETPLCLYLSSIFPAVGVATLPLLARSLDKAGAGDRTRIRKWPLPLFAFLYGAPILTYHLLSISCLVQGKGAPFEGPRYFSNLENTIGISGFLGLISALLILCTAARRRAGRHNIARQLIPGAALSAGKALMKPMKSKGFLLALATVVAISLIGTGATWKWGKIRLWYLTNWNGDLVGANLSGANLEGVDLAGADLRGANLRNAVLWNANLEGANLAGANLERVHLSNANLSDTNLKNVDLSDAYLRRANLSRANLANANLEGASLEGAYLRDADLSGAILRDSLGLWHAYLWNANLEGVDLRGTAVNLYGSIGTPSHMPGDPSEE